MVFVLAFLIMALVTAAMAIGALAGRGPLKGSCGGIAALGIEGRCAICGDDWASTSSATASTSSATASTGSATASTSSATEEDNSGDWRRRDECGTVPVSERGAGAGADFYDAG